MFATQLSRNLKIWAVGRLQEKILSCRQVLTSFTQLQNRSRCGKDENDCEMYKPEKSSCKAAVLLFFKSA
mgnify:CR=1 FL=1